MFAESFIMPVERTRPGCMHWLEISFQDISRMFLGSRVGENFLACSGKTVVKPMPHQPTPYFLSSSDP